MVVYDDGDDGDDDNGEEAVVLVQRCHFPLRNAGRRRL